MKTKSTLFVAACSMLAAVPVLAQSTATDADENGYYNGIEKTTVVQITDDEGFAIQLDGVADEAVWARAQELSCDKVQTDWGVAPVENIDNFTCKFKLLYDASSIYVYFTIADPNRVSIDQFTPSKSENCDNVELFFYPNITERQLVDGTVHDMRTTGLSQIRIARGAADNYVTGGGYALGLADKNVIAGLEYGIADDETTGWSAEVVIPWDAIINAENMENAQEGGQLMFDISAANAREIIEGDATRYMMIAWSINDFQGWKDNNRLGEITLGGPASGIKAVEAAVDYTFAQGVLSMDVENGTPVSVLDLSGRTVASYVYDSAIDLSSLASGIYMVKAENAAAFKIVK